jgi:hypothetical protein
MWRGSPRRSVVGGVAWSSRRGGVPWRRAALEGGEDSGIDL